MLLPIVSVLRELGLRDHEPREEPAAGGGCDNGNEDGNGNENGNENERGGEH